MSMKSFHKTGFVIVKTEGVNVGENLDEIDLESVFDNWEGEISYSEILYENYVNVDKYVDMFGEISDMDIIAKVMEKRLRMKCMEMMRNRISR
ncbi:hypothetical protein NPIL_387011 [Nephila pilipes]|uniref:Uncharacterized protein n=1 Tax=Nephila pilipes TaxID=299642 RepID=A0A8X6PY92_NEPPI|nr:hypothetical protein NPIL_387011 [Nephila pilipes]